MDSLAVVCGAGGGNRLNIGGLGHMSAGRATKLSGSSRGTA